MACTRILPRHANHGGVVTRARTQITIIARAQFTSIARTRIIARTIICIARTCFIIIARNIFKCIARNIVKCMAKNIFTSKARTITSYVDSWIQELSMFREGLRFTEQIWCWAELTFWK